MENIDNHNCLNRYIKLEFERSQSVKFQKIYIVTHCVNSKKYPNILFMTLKCQKRNISHGETLSIDTKTILVEYTKYRDERKLQKIYGLTHIERSKTPKQMLCSPKISKRNHQL